MTPPPPWPSFAGDSSAGGFLNGSPLSATSSASSGIGFLPVLRENPPKNIAASPPVLRLPPRMVGPRRSSPPPAVPLIPILISTPLIWFLSRLASWEIARLEKQALWWFSPHINFILIFNLFFLNPSVCLFFWFWLDQVCGRWAGEK